MADDLGSPARRPSRSAEALAANLEAARSEVKELGRRVNSLEQKIDRLCDINEALRSTIASMSDLLVDHVSHCTAVHTQLREQIQGA